ncbi:hypothetical protein BDV96DRAFT_685701 [Lophiotrema nucula]|uniref:Uncharacterized protein n=1 Tax=Lophiotrema nucula TaxID=690887 RepID=A0A6A5ZBX9_9PLEO|nr:hypothetical protein BDV96DRAFT_685701 [Lophiotrema nucula]
MYIKQPDLEFIVFTTIVPLLKMSSPQHPSGDRDRTHANSSNSSSSSSSNTSGRSQQTNSQTPAPHTPAGQNTSPASSTPSTKAYSHPSPHGTQNSSSYPGPRLPTNPFPPMFHPQLTPAMRAERKADADKKYQEDIARIEEKAKAKATAEGRDNDYKVNDNNYPYLDDNQYRQD